MATRRSAHTMAEEILSQTLDRLSLGYYEEARVLAERLPNEGKARFVRQAAEALYLRNEFGYRSAARIFRRFYETAQIFSNDREVGNLARTTARLASSASKIGDLIDLFHKAQQAKAEAICHALDPMMNTPFAKELLPRTCSISFFPSKS